MDVSIRDEGEIRVVGFEGDLDTNTAPDGEKRLDEAIAEGATKIVLTMKLTRR